MLNEWMLLVDDMRVSLTEVALTPSEFDTYQVSERASLTFCLKELRVSLQEREGGRVWSGSSGVELANES